MAISSLKCRITAFKIYEGIMPPHVLLKPQVAKSRTLVIHASTHTYTTITLELCTNTLLLNLDRLA